MHNWQENEKGSIDEFINSSEQWIWQNKKSDLAETKWIEQNKKSDLVETKWIERNKMTDLVETKGLSKIRWLI